MEYVQREFGYFANAQYSRSTEDEYPVGDEPAVNGVRTTRSGIVIPD